METIRILIYTDDDAFIDNPSSIDGGLSDLQNFVTYKTKGIANVTFASINRHGHDPITKREINAAHRITRDLLLNYEELWVFGLRQIDTPEEPHNELQEDEVTALEEWMLNGGVFVTGDHSSPDPTLRQTAAEEEEHEDFLGLGRALGYRIPRAGQLRVWKGPPTLITDGELADLDNFNTQEGNDPCLLDDPLLQADSVPQTLILELKECEPHPLFSYAHENGDVTKIVKFPDHWHEGLVVVPDQLNSEWPVHSPDPKIIASGTDKRFPDEKRTGGVVVAYDGDQVCRGRIVADSSFHHYLNRNLKHLLSRNAMGLPTPGSDLDQIAEYYGNLAIWLAPSRIRDNIKLGLLLRLAQDPDIVEVIGSTTEIIGRAARGVLIGAFGRSKMQRLFRPSKFEKPGVIDELFSIIFLGSSSSATLAFEKPDLFLGSAIKVCQILFRDRGKDITTFYGDASVIAGLKNAVLGAARNQMDVLGEVLK